MRTVFRLTLTTWQRQGEVVESRARASSHERAVAESGVGTLVSWLDGRRTQVGCWTHCFPVFAWERTLLRVVVRHAATASSTSGSVGSSRIRQFVDQTSVKRFDQHGPRSSSTMFLRQTPTLVEPSEDYHEQKKKQLLLYCWLWF